MFYSSSVHIRHIHLMYEREGGIIEWITFGVGDLLELQRFSV